MDIKQLGYLGLSAREPDAFAEYATSILGMQRVPGEDGVTHFRIDDRHHRVSVEAAEHDGGAYYGWELADASSLSAAMDELSDRGIEAVPATQRELEIRRVAGMAHFLDPAGNRVELYHGAAAGDGEFTSARDVERFVTGDLGLGHVVLASPDVAAQQRFYTDVLGFKISDTMRAPFHASFLHTNPRHHSIAFVDGPFFGVDHPFLHHFMLEVPDMDQVGHTYDLALDRNVPITMTLGRHTNDKVFSFYAESPVGVHTEFGSGGVLIDDATWEVTEIPGPDLWGHRH
ncbi:VOC family protein [Actinomadura sp. 3N508]|uniref:VOC family protein n=1 Tax=Actinomadura sp. 3N508 TaxID=3375153 RepID=UPI0037B64731